MGIKEIPTSEFVKFLESLGLVQIRTRGSHTSFNYPEGNPKRLPQPVIVRTNEHMIPRLHIHTNLQTMGISKNDFIAYQRNQMKGFKSKKDK